LDIDGLSDVFMSAQDHCALDPKAITIKPAQIAMGKIGAATAEIAPTV
tara:strand:- start:719 stop:862 length:144 start_codon:yes stop_codon:yes gene_type:complete